MHLIAQTLLNTRADLLRAARARLRNPHWAEDAVSETVLAALERPPAITEPGRLRAWLFGTLRHKLVDQLRTGLATAPGTDADPDGQTHDLLDMQASADPGPERLAMDREFLAELESLLQTLPGRQAEAFWMAECGDGTRADICRSLAVTETHLGVLVHRARHKLRSGLQHHR